MNEVFVILNFIVGLWYGTTQLRTNFKLFCKFFNEKLNAFTYHVYQDEQSNRTIAYCVAKPLGLEHMFL